MLGALLIATLSINDAKMFFQGGEAMPNVVESVPGDSLRAGAIMPEVYGTISGWLERARLYVDPQTGHGITNLTVAKTAVLDSYYQWPTGCGIINSNRVVTTRPVWQCLLNGIADSMYLGGPSIYPGIDRYPFVTVESSTALGGRDWPTIDWTYDFVGAMSSNEWAEIWTTFDNCDDDGVWRKMAASGRGDVAATLRERYNGDFDEDYADLYLYLQAWASPKSCLDILKEKIGDEAYALTNRTLRIDRRFLTALENALGLCDIIQNHGGIVMPNANFVDLTHRCSQFATATTAATWTYSQSTGRISMSTDDLSWSYTNSVYTTTNNLSFSENLIAVTHGSSESAELHAVLGSSITIPASNIYTKAVAAANGHTQGRWDAVETYSIDGITGYKMAAADHPSGEPLYDFYISLDLDGLAGTNTLIVSASASQSHRVIYSIPEFTYWDINNYGNIPSPLLWRNGFVESVDLAFLPICTRWVGSPSGEYADGYPMWGYDPIQEYASIQLTVRGGQTADMRSTLEGKAREYITHAASHVNSLIGGHVGVRADMIPLSQNSVFTSEVLSQASTVTRGGPAFIKTALQTIFLDGPSERIVVVYDGNSQSYEGLSGYPVRVAELSYSADSSITNDLPHVEAAGAEVNCPLDSRAKMKWRNLRFEDD